MKTSLQTTISNLTNERDEIASSWRVLGRKVADRAIDELNDRIEALYTQMDALTSDDDMISMAD